MIKISEVEPGSSGAEAGFEAGDRIHSINGHPISDLIDYRVFSADAQLCIEVERDNERYEVDLYRVPGETMGLSFDEMRLRRCNNKCVFCFIHQMPEGLRPSRYFEDDDYRLAFLHGSYVTLTNIKEADLQRIVEHRLSPQYISVHATNPDLRQRMLGRKLPVDILDRVRFLAEHGIEMHAQIVVCPGWNDGPHLRQTVEDLARFYPQLRSMALVPVGLTKFRQGLPDLSRVTPELSKRYVDEVFRWGEEYRRVLGERLVYAADELFLTSGIPVPDSDYYDAFPQLENGIGMTRSFIDTFVRERSGMPKRLYHETHVALVTGALAASFVGQLVAPLNLVPGLKVDVVAVENRYFGDGITVSGLLTGADMIDQLAGETWDHVLLPPNCVNGDGLTLDDMTPAGIGTKLKHPVSVGSYDLCDSIKAITQNKISMEQLGTGRQLNELGYRFHHR